MIGDKITSAALQRSPRFARLLVDAYAEGFAPFFWDSPELAANGITLPPGIDLVQVIHDYIQLSMLLCQDDYPTEIRATIGFVDGQMDLHGIGNRQ